MDIGLHKYGHDLVKLDYIIMVVEQYLVLDHGSFIRIFAAYEPFIKLYAFCAGDHVVTAGVKAHETLYCFLPEVFHEKFHLAVAVEDHVKVKVIDTERAGTPSFSARFSTKGMSKCLPLYVSI